MCGPDSTTATAVTTTAAATAQRGANRVSTSHTTIGGRASSGSCTAASTGARQIGNRMPASIALAIGRGIRVMVRASQGHSPVASSSTPQSRNAPTAAWKSPVVLWAATSRAAPGVDQANDNGSRYRRLSPMASTPWKTQSTSSPDAASASVAPTARRPAISRAKELANPVIDPTMPAVIGWTIDTGFMVESA